MFNAQRALRPLDRKKLTPEQLYKELRGIRSRYMKDLPLEFRTEDLFMLAKSRNWVQRDEDGRITIVIS
jgi:hypothetical protein